MSKTHFKSQSESNYLGSWDLEDYKDIDLTIKEVKAEMTVGLKPNAVKNIAYFVEKGYKPMLLNITNSKQIKRFTRSPYIEDWKMISVTIGVQRDVEAFGELHDALRIRAVKPRLKPELTPKSELWAKAKEAVKAGATFESINKNYKISKENFKKLSE